MALPSETIAISEHRLSNLVLAEPLPQEWTDQFDMVWSQEAFCHAMNQNALIAEVSRVLKPGGTIVFSDIMQGDDGGDCTSFTGQNVTTELASPATYKVCQTFRIDAQKPSAVYLACTLPFSAVTTHLCVCVEVHVSGSQSMDLNLPLLPLENPIWQRAHAGGHFKGWHEAC